MPNSIAKFKNYIDLLDEVYKEASLTDDLAADATLVREGANANEIIVPKMELDGLADYSRNNGYVSGSVTLTHETLAFNYDRGRKFNVDTLDNQETAGVAFGRLAGEFVRTKATPELDAYKFASIAGTSGIGTATAALATGEAWIAAISTGAAAMDNAEVPTDGRILYITPTGLRLIQDLDTTKSREVLDSFNKVVKVPQGRFYTAIDLADGSTSGEEAGGYAKAQAGANINFLIVQKDAVLSYVKHRVNKVIEPEANQENDGWLFFYRAYAICKVYANKVAGVYLHKAA